LLARKILDGPFETSFRKKEKEGIPAIKSRCCGIRNSDLWLWNVSEEPVQRGGGGAEWRGLGSAESRK
jgi:hypothetical protein